MHASQQVVQALRLHRRRLRQQMLRLLLLAAGPRTRPAGHPPKVEAGQRPVRRLRAKEHEM